jgi:hypothetical protein
LLVTVALAAGSAAAAGAGAGAVPAAGTVPAEAASETLVTSSDLTYVGSFLLPDATSNEDTFDYGGTAMAYDPGRNGLFVVGHDWYQLDAEVSIPAPLASTDLAGLPVATWLQPFTDATDGLIDATGVTGNPNKIGGQLVYGGKLIGSVFNYYDAADQQVVSHYVRPSTSLSSGTATGLYQVGTMGAGMVSGYMALVPPEWQSALGGPALTGQCCIPIVSRTSYGPSAFAFDPSDLGATSPVPDTPLLYYTGSNSTLGAWNGGWDPAAGEVYDGTTAIRGMVFPDGTRSVLYFGQQGVGPFCYGGGTSDPNQAGKTINGVFECYDPDDSSKGTHGYPYQAWVWAYDAGELAKVASGAEQPWQVKPSGVWQLDLPNFGSTAIGGVAYDPSRGLIYLSQQGIAGPNHAAPVIDVYRVDVASTGAPTGAGGGPSGTTGTVGDAGGGTSTTTTTTTAPVPVTTRPTAPPGGGSVGGGRHHHHNRPHGRPDLLVRSATLIAAAGGTAGPALALDLDCVGAASCRGTVTLRAALRATRRSGAAAAVDQPGRSASPRNRSEHVAAGQGWGIVASVTVDLAPSARQTLTVALSPVGARLLQGASPTAPRTVRVVERLRGGGRVSAETSVT